MRGPDIPVQRLLVSALCALALTLSASLADEAGDAYRKGVEARESRDPISAVRHFHRAATLDPANRRYQRALEAAQQNAATALAERASTETNPVRRYEALVEALIYVPGHPRATQLMEEFTPWRARVADEVGKALSRHSAGEFADCVRLSRAHETWRPLIPALQELARAAEVERLVERGRRKLVEEDQPLAALQSVERARSVEPDWAPAIQLFDDALRRLGAKTLDSVRAAESDVGVVAFLKEASTAAGLAGRFPLGGAFRDGLRASVDRILKRVGSALDALGTDRDGVASRFLRARLLEELRRRDLSDYLPESAAGTKLLRLRLTVVAPEAGCLPGTYRTRLEEAFAAALPDWIALLPEGRFRLVTSGLRCEGKQLDEQDVQKHASAYATGEKPVPNPDYVRLEEQLQAADREIDLLAGPDGAGPDGNGGEETAARMANLRQQATKIRDLLETTPPRVSETETAAYEYESYRQLRSFEIQGSLRLLDRERNRSTPAVPFRAEARSEDVGLRGVRPTDTNDHSNRAPRLAAWTEIKAEGYRMAAERAAAASLDLIRMVEAAQACDSARAGDFAGALAHGSAFKDLSEGGESAAEFVTVDVPHLRDLLVHPPAVPGQIKAFRALCQYNNLTEAAENRVP